jgi:pyruvate,water dikinase
MMRFIMQPEEDSFREIVGGKANALAQLAKAGLPVPDWFVLTPGAFAASLSEAQHAALAAACHAGDATAAQVALREVRLAADVQDELTRALASLAPQGEPVAVRSSALDEDGRQHSFAGQFESFLNVAPDDVAARIVDVWRSGFSARILAYRREHGLATIPTVPAVIVQRMVNATAAGVAFSADPVSGRRGVAVVSAVAGLGDALVSGACDADTYHISREGDISTRTLAGTTAVLDDAQAQAVAALARRCEQQSGVPQDIEWAIEDGALWLLQSRPITSLAGQPDPDGAYARWDNSNIAESYGGVTTPLTFSFARHAYEAVYRQLCRLMGVPEATISEHDETFRRMIGLVRGRVYYNLLSWYELLALAPGFASNRRFMEQMMGVREGLPEQIVAKLPTVTWRGRLYDRYRFARTILNLLRSYRRLPRDIRHFYVRVERALALDGRALETMRPDELVAYYRNLERQLLTRWDAPLVNDLFAMMSYGLLRRLAVSWYHDTSGALANDLIRDTGDIISAEPAQRVRELAELAAPEPALITALCNDSLRDINRVMPETPAFAAAYDAYLAKFADRCLEELKLESPTLRDDPLLLLRTIGHLAHEMASRAHDDGPAVVRSAVETAPGWRAAAKPADAGSSQTSLRSPHQRPIAYQRPDSPLLAGEGLGVRSSSSPLPRTGEGPGVGARLAFRWILRQARARVRDRENLRFERTRVFGRVRRIFVELGKRFSALGLLDDPQGIFYLEVEEALGFVSGTATTTDLKGLVAVRRAEFARYRSEEPPPDSFETHGIPHLGEWTSPPAPLSREARGNHRDAAECRTGLGCCPGVVRGRVRVVTDPRRAEMRAGEILVAERTDPGWILLFASAAGVVVERGSLLSHSAIVARELGIPAIVSVPGVISWLRTGDWIEMDGGAGVVTKITAPAEHTPMESEVVHHAEYV